jgi:hypothetical protein
LQVGQGGKEGFKVMYDVGGDAITRADVNTSSTVPGFWDAAAGPRPRGYVVEFVFALSSIDIIDGGGEISPSSGSSIGFNVTVGDDDNGGFPYNDLFVGGPIVEPTDTYGAWDGSSANWFDRREDDWGTLHFAPRPNGAAKQIASPSPKASTWGQIKSEQE